MADPTELLAALQPILDHLRHVDTGSPDFDTQAAQAQLAHRFPLEGEDLRAVRLLVEAGLEEGWLCPRENAGIRFGRLARASAGTHGYAIDAVDMRGPGPGHTHPRGEFDLCLPLDGEPRFDGNAPGWTVYGPQTWHTPTVTGGRMAILYFLPGGEIRFEPAPQA